MQLQRLHARRYRSLRDVELDFSAINVLIGANASGKSNILDALRLLAQGVREKNFEEPVRWRGGLNHLAWKGEQAQRVVLESSFHDEGQVLVWTVELEAQQGALVVNERLVEDRDGRVLLETRNGVGRWRTRSTGSEARSLALRSGECSLAAAAVDPTFPGTSLAEFVRAWSFLDPTPDLLRRASAVGDDAALDEHGRNLAARLKRLKEEDPAAFELILRTMRAVLGVPDAIDFQSSEDDGRVHFVQNESGLRYRVHQVGASSGTLRVLALLTGLLGDSRPRLIGLEEPENYVHPEALDGLAQLFASSRPGVQVVITTHSPLLLNRLDVPEAICIVRRGAQGTEVRREPNPEGVRQALKESGFGLGELYQTSGFGA